MVNEDGHATADTITWVHLSDLHFQESQAYDKNLILKTLLRDVSERIVEDGLRPDLIAVSGDIAFSGKPAEYDLARRFFDDLLHATGLNKDRLFLVPGNHDVDRSLITRAMNSVGDSLLDRRSVNQVLSTPGDRRLMMARFQGYAAFVNDYLGEYIPFDDEHYFYVRSLDLSGQRVALLGLNSAWLCASDEDRAKRLLIGERQVREALDQAEGADLKIALIHHPFDWLREFDRNDSDFLLIHACDFILHGHLHRAGAAQLVTPGDAAMVLACGACYETHQLPNIYNWVQLHPETGRGTVYVRRYSDMQGGLWVKDSLTYRDILNGVYQFTWPGSRRLWAAPPRVAKRDQAPASEINSGPPADMITWLHISDLHFQESQIYDENRVLNALLRDLVEKQVRPDFIAVSGDIAFSGKPAEYDLARRFFDDLLQTTGLGKDRLFLVPGNHDVDRSLITRAMHSIGDSLLDQPNVNEVLSTPVERQLMMTRFQGYAAFVNDYLGEYIPFDDEHYFYVRSLELCGQRVALLGLNSAWLCASEEDGAKGLLIGERQVREALDQAEGADLKIALIHHPFDWLREFDRNDSESLLIDTCDFVLHGHLHRAGAVQSVTPGGAAMVLACGACYETRQPPNIYNWVQLDPAVRSGSVHIRRYLDRQGGFWAKDSFTYRNVPDGVYQFAWPHPHRVWAANPPVVNEDQSPASEIDSSHPADTIAWLHISDLHFQESQPYDKNLILETLLRDVSERIVEDGMRPDFIAVSGDIAFSGKPAEYDLARRFFDDLLHATGLNKDRLFLVPGNHDVDRNLITRAMHGAGDSLQDRRSVNQVLSTPADRRLMMARFQGYAAFVNDYLGGYTPFDDEHYFYVRSLELCGQRVALLGLNSAWLCASEEDGAKGLLIGERQVREALQQADGADLKIALIHHPFDWLREFDRSDSEALLIYACDFILHGHLRRAGAAQRVTPDDATMVLACGACYETHQLPNMYNWVQLDLAVRSGTAYIRRYSDVQGGLWVPDILSYRNTPQGKYRFPFGRRGAVPPPPVATRARPTIEPDHADVTGSNLASGSSPVMVPFPHNPGFVGREADLARLHEMVWQGTSPVGIRPTVLVGLGGIGKTQLAVEYAHAHRADYTGGIFWLNAVNPLLLEFAALAETLGLAMTETPRDQAARAAWSYLDARPDALVILDCVEEPSQLDEPVVPGLILASLRCHTLFTSRQRDLPRNFQLFEVMVLPEEAAMRLLLRARPEIRDNEHHPERPWARMVCFYLGWLPLALELAASCLESHPEVTVQGYLERLRVEGALSILDDSEVRFEDLPTRLQEMIKSQPQDLVQRPAVSVTATLRTQWNRLDDEDARTVFQATGQLPEPTWISTALLGLLTRVETTAAPGHLDPLSRALRKLHAVSLIEDLTSDRIRLHPLVREFAAKLTSATVRQQYAANVVTAFEDLTTLENWCVRHGIDELLADLIATLRLLTSGGEVSEDSRGLQNRLDSLLRLLRRESHLLRGWDPTQQPAFFAQIVYARAMDTGMTQMVSSAVARLSQLGALPLSSSEATTQQSPALECILAGHQGTAAAVAVVPDGRRAVSGSVDATARVWDLETGQELLTLSGHTDEVHSVAVTPDGRRMVSGSADRTVRVWDLNTGQQLLTLQAHADRVEAVAVTPDGRKAVSGSRDNTIRVWDLETGQLLRALAGHTDGVYAVAVAPDGRHATSASADRTLKVWDLASGQELATLTGHEGLVNAVAVTHDGLHLVSASADHTLKVWDLAAGQEVATLTGHEGSVNTVAVTYDGLCAVSGSADRTVKVWDLVSGQELSTLTGHEDSVNAVALTPDGHRIISASADHTLKIWDLPSSQTIPEPAYPPSIFGLHDTGEWTDAFTATRRTGWVMINHVVDDRAAQAGDKRLIEWSRAGYGVLVRLVNAPFDREGQSDGSVPSPDGYADFARRCAEFVRHSPGCHTWFIGNEMNIEWHWPVDSHTENPAGRPITPQGYAACFAQVYRAIKAVQPDARVIPSGLNPLRNPRGRHDDAMDWFQSMLKLVGEMDGIDIHAYFPLREDRTQVKYYTFEDFMAAVPQRWRDLPVFITEASPPEPWPEPSDGWIQRAYSRVNRWNCNPGRQRIYALLPYRWQGTWPDGSADPWNLVDKLSYHDDLRQVLQYDYRWSIDPDKRAGPVLDRARALAKIRLVRSSLFAIEADALVNPTGPQADLQGAVSRQLAAYIPKEVLEEVHAAAPLPFGTALSTEAGTLPMRHILHVSIGDWQPLQGEPAVEAPLVLADRLGDVEHIAFPAMGTGAGGVSPERSAALILPAAVDYLQRGSRLQQITFALMDEATYNAYEDVLRSLEPQIWFVTANPEQYDWNQAFDVGSVQWSESHGAEAQKNVRQVRPGDVVLASHSSPGCYITGLGHIVNQPYELKDRYAVQIDMDLKLQTGVSAEELKQATPDLQDLTRPLSFSPVTAEQWAVIRELLLFRNPHLATDDLPPITVPQRNGLAIEKVDMPTECTVGEMVHATLHLRNQGNLTWRTGKQLTLLFHWQVARPIIQDITDQLPVDATKRYPTRSLTDISRIVIHHTATSPTITPQRLAEYQVRQLDKPGIVYHFVVAANGTIFQTNKLETVSDHAFARNQESVGVVLPGNFNDAIPTEAQLKATGQLLAWLLSTLHLPREKIVGLGEFVNTQSPGKQWLSGQHWKDKLLTEVEASLGASSADQPEESTGFDSASWSEDGGSDSGNWRSDREDAGSQQWVLEISQDVPPGGIFLLESMLEISISPGHFEAQWMVSGLDWEVQVEPAEAAVTVAVIAPLPYVKILNRLSPSAESALLWAEGLRQKLGATKLFSDYLLAGLYQKDEGSARGLLTLFDDATTIDSLLQDLVNKPSGTLISLTDVQPATRDVLRRLPLSANTSKAMNQAATLASEKGSAVVHSRHLLAGLLSVPESAVGRWVAGQLQVERETLYHLIADALKQEPPLLDIWWASARRVTVLTGHVGTVTSLAFSSEGARLTSSGEDATLRTWSLLRGTSLSDPTQLSGPVRSVIVTFDGSRRILAMADGSLLEMSQDGNAITPVPTAGDEVIQAADDAVPPALALSPDGQWLATARHRGVLTTRNLSTGEQTRLVRSLPGPVAALTISPSGKYVAAASPGPAVSVWSPSGGSELFYLVGHEDWVNAMAFTSDETRLVSASDDQTLRVWDLQSGQQLFNLRGHDCPVRAVLATLDGRWVVSGGDDGRLKLWDLASGRDHATLRGHEAAVSALALSPDGRRLASGDEIGIIRLWDLVNVAAALPQTISREEALSRLTFTQNDLLELPADAWLNSTNSNLSLGNTGKKIAAAMGPIFEQDLRQQAPQPVGSAIVTQGVGLLVRYIISVPIYDRAARRRPTLDVIGQAVQAALQKAEALPDVKTLVIPSIGTTWGELLPRAIASTVIETALDHLEHGSRLEKITFSNSIDEIHVAYLSAYADLGGKIESRSVPWFCDLTGLEPGERWRVNKKYTVTLHFNRLEGWSIPVPNASARLTTFLDVPPGIQLESERRIEIAAQDGNLLQTEVTYSLRPVLPGSYQINFHIHPGRNMPEVSSTVRGVPVQVAEAAIIEDIPEILDRALIPSPKPDVQFYVVLQPVPGSQQMQIFVTCPALRMDMLRFGPLKLTAADARAIRQTATELALGATVSAEGEMAMRRFGMMLFDLLLPVEAGNGLRTFYGRLTELAQSRLLSWLIISDAQAALPWELVVPYGFQGKDRAGKLVSEDFLAARYIISHWIGRQGLHMAREAPLYRLELVHYDQCRQDNPSWQQALGGERWVALQKKPGELLLTVPESDIVGMHLLRFAGLERGGGIMRAHPPGEELSSDARTERGMREAREHRLDFSARHPIVGLSAVDGRDLPKGGHARHFDLEEDWVLDLLRGEASAVVGARWPTSAEVDRRFFNIFYEALRQGQRLGKAIRVARLGTRAAFPGRCDWLAYAHFGHPLCDVYPVQTATAFATFEVVDHPDDQPLEEGRTYRFRASYGAMAPDGFKGRVCLEQPLPPLTQPRVIIKADFEKGARNLPLNRRELNQDLYEADFVLCMPESKDEGVVSVYFYDGDTKLHTLHVELALKGSNRA